MAAGPRPAWGSGDADVGPSAPQTQESLCGTSLAGAVAGMWRVRQGAFVHGGGRPDFLEWGELGPRGGPGREGGPRG